MPLTPWQLASLSINIASKFAVQRWRFEAVRGSVNLCAHLHIKTHMHAFYAHTSTSTNNDISGTRGRGPRFAYGRRPLAHANHLRSGAPPSVAVVSSVVPMSDYRKTPNTRTRSQHIGTHKHTSYILQPLCPAIDEKIFHYSMENLILRTFPNMLITGALTWI